jgi:phosphoglycerate dehydrogenase-like enzyme
MEHNTVLVLSNPTEPQLGMLEQLPPETGIAVGNCTEAFERAASAADVIFNWSLAGDLLREVFQMCPRVQWVHTRSAGLDNILFPELIESAVPLTNGTGVFSPSLGEFALAGILYFAKDLRRMIRAQEAGVWEQFDITEIVGQTVGIVGYGDIGRAVASRVKAMGMRVIAVKRSGPLLYNMDPLVERIYRSDQLDEFLPQCDYVVVAAPLTPATKGMIGREAFAAMKPDAVVINVGRGPVIDEGAMVEALAGGRIKGAVLDVFEQEPLPAGHPLYSLKNVLLSPHCADHTPDWLERAMQFFVDQFGRFVRREPLMNVVDKRAGY